MNLMTMEKSASERASMYLVVRFGLSGTSGAGYSAHGVGGGDFGDMTAPWGLIRTETSMPGRSGSTAIVGVVWLRSSGKAMEGSRGKARR